MIVQYQGVGPLSVNHGTWYSGETHTVTPKQYAALCSEHGASVFAIQGTLEMVITPAAADDPDAVDAVEPLSVTVETPKRRAK
jgi:hypothetical protein